MLLYLSLKFSEIILGQYIFLIWMATNQYQESRSRIKNQDQDQDQDQDQVLTILISLLSSWGQNLEKLETRTKKSSIFPLLSKNAHISLSEIWVLLLVACQYVCFSTISFDICFWEFWTSGAWSRVMVSYIVACSRIRGNMVPLITCAHRL